ncbi:helix-turn-helix transcriptional regulator [Saccharopolyspora sp. NPDC047091]|uniref:helix-turn-helix domain-containing protein n=1 Tax=Saccharopolyspora sp. NPDC047091 TaxID=3155924 RepID=UPI0033CFCAD8
MPETTPSPRAYILGSEIREARKRCGHSLRAMGEKLDVAHSVIARWERGERVPGQDSIVALCAVLDINGEARERVITLAREAAAELANSVSVGADGEADVLAALMDFERNAQRITNVAPVVIPGLLQTSDYARAIVDGSASNAERDRMVSMRIGRRDVLTRRRNPVQYTAFLLEWSLLQPIGDDAAMRDQLEFLIEMSERENVTIRVVPQSAGWTPIHAGQYVLLEFAKASPVVLMEHLRSSTFLRDEGDVRAFVEARDDIETMAMSPADTVGLIGEVLERRG